MEAEVRFHGVQTKRIVAFHLKVAKLNFGKSSVRIPLLRSGPSKFAFLTRKYSRPKHSAASTLYNPHVAQVVKLHETKVTTALRIKRIHPRYHKLK